VIEAVGLTKRYGPTLAVDDLSFTVKPGLVTGFLGPNGAGKSTTMRMILGLDKPTGGVVRIDGKTYQELHSPLRTVGALLDAKWVHPNRSAHSHLLWLARSNGLPTRRVTEVLDLVGLTAVARRRAGGYSLGMSQRLGIAAALLGDPGVLLFDEPVNGLDPEGIVWIRTFMQSLAAEGRTVLVSSHLLSEMALTAEELIVIGKGRLITQCATSEFIERSSAATVFVRSPQLPKLEAALAEKGFAVESEGEGLRVSGAGTEEVGDVAAAVGAVVHELAVRRASLEQAFMSLTEDAVEYQTGRDAVAEGA
jgi:ABC-2 type transport system ATP-binding protein